MTDNKTEILQTRIGGLGSSDAPMVYRIGLRGEISEADKYRIAVLLGLKESKIFSTEATRLGTEIENRIFDFLKLSNPDYISNPKYESKELSKKYGFSIFNHIDYELEEEKTITWFENKAVLETELDKIFNKYVTQLAWHFMLLKEKAKKLNKDYYLYLTKFDTNGFNIEDPIDVNRLDFLPVNYKDVLPYILILENGLQIIKDAIPTFEYIEPETIDANCLPQVQVDYMNEIAERLNIIEQHKLEVEEFKTKMYELMQENNIKSVKNEFFTMTVVNETTTMSFDSKRLQKEKPDIYKKYQKKGKKKGFLKITLKDNNNN